MITENFSVTAVIAVFNGAVHIVEALDSVLDQTAPVAEIVIVDDGSSDDSVDVIQRYISLNSTAELPISLVLQENSGQGSARNTGVSHATGQIIGFLDQDDSWHPQHVEKLISYFENNPSLGWVYSDFNQFDEYGLYLRRSFLKLHSYVPPAKSLFALIGNDLMMLPSASLIRKKAYQEVEGFDTQFRGYEDDDLFVRIFAHGWNFEFCEQGLVNYRIHANNSSRGLSFPESRRKFYRKYREYLSQGNENYPKYFHQHLAPRMVSAIIQDAVIAGRDGSPEAKALAISFLKEIYEDKGFTARDRLTLLLVRSDIALRVALAVRRKFKKIVKPELTY